MADAPKKPAGSPEAMQDDDDPIAELLEGGDFDFTGEGEALGDLLGAPPPPLPPPPIDSEVLSSTPRPPPARAVAPSPAAAPALSAAPPAVHGSTMPEPPTDEEIFGDLDAAFARMVPEVAAAAAKRAGARGEDAFGGTTRIASVDDDLLKKSSESGEPGSAAGPAAPAAAAPVRRTAAVVRRDSLRDVPAPKIVDREGGEDTRIADPAAMSAVAQGAEPEESGEMIIETSAGALDEFYDDIEIGSASDEPSATPAPVARAAAGAAAAPRRVTRNVIRRGQGAATAAEASRTSGAVTVQRPAPQAAVTTRRAPASGASSALAAAAAPARSGAARASAPPVVDARAASVAAAVAPAAVAPAPATRRLGAGYETGDIRTDVYAQGLPHPAPLGPLPVRTPGDPEAATRSGRGAAATMDLRIDPARFRFPAQGHPEADDDLGFCSLVEREIERSLSLPLEVERNARLHLLAGQAAERAGELARAREHYEEACHDDPKLLPGFRAMRRLLLRQREHREAIRYLDVELELSAPAEKLALAAYRADLFLAIGEQDLARVAFGELVDARPDDLRALLAQIELAWSDERDDELLHALQVTAPQVEDPQLCAALAVLRGRVLERVGADDQLIERAYRAALEAHGTDRSAMLGLVRLALRRGRSADAGVETARFLEQVTDPSLLAAAARREAVAALRSGDPARAAKVLADLGTTDDPLVLESLAEAYLASPRPEDLARAALALAAWAQVETAPARRAELLRRLAALQAGPLGDPAAAALSLREAAAADPSDLDTEADLEAAYLAAGEVEAAATLARTAAAQEEDGGPWLRLHAAGIYERAGRLDEAIAELQAARVAAPLSDAVAEALTRVLLAAGRHAELATHLADTADLAYCDAASALERAAAAADTAARERLGDRPWAQADDQARASVAAAENAWGAVLDAEPACLAAHAALERWARARGDQAGLAATAAGEQAVTVDPVRMAALALRQAALASDTARTTRLAALDASGAPGAPSDQPDGDFDPREALEQVLAADPLDPRAAAYLADSAAAAGRWAEAAQRWAARAEALPEGPERDACRFRAAAAFADQAGEAARAAPLLQAVVAARPGFAAAGARLERSLRALGDAAALAALLEREVADPPVAVPARLRAVNLLRLAEALAFQVGDAGRAAVCYRQALELVPGDPLAREGFARVAVAAGELAPLADLALADLERAEAGSDAAAKVAAYEELARIDGDLRGDVASATLAWESVAALDPLRMPALRALERIYLAEGGHAELTGIYAKLAEALAASPPDVMAILIARARLHDVLGDPAAALADFQAAAERVPTSRFALFRLEMRARDAGALEDLAALDDLVAAYFHDEARGRAGFLTRAGEALAGLGRTDEALERFRAAAETVPGFVPALRAWRRVALIAERWVDAADACEREAQSARSDVERARLLHLAGVLAMDGALDAERAIASLRHVLALDPGHDDAFLRLRKLWAGQGKHAELAELLSGRVEREIAPEKLVEHHQALAALYRDSLGDPERAKTHLRAVLARDRANLAAITALSEVTWDLGEWSEAASALISRAKLERNQEALKEIFFRLGIIYADKLPDVRWATKSFERVLKFDPNDLSALEYLSNLSIQSGDWRVALGATERLVSLDPEPATRIVHLHRVARIFEEGYQDRKRAEDALRRALDVDPASPSALAAVVDFYQRLHDAASLRVNLDRVGQTMRARLQRDPFDGAVFHIMARALAARSGIGIPGSIEAARCAAEVAAILGSADEADRALAAEALHAPPPVRGLGELAIDEALFHPSIPNGFRQVFRMLYDTMAKRYPADLRRHGVGKAERLPRGGNATREILAQLAGDLGVKDFEVYVSNQHPNLVAVELTEPVSLIVGAHVVSAGAPQLRFAAGRSLKLAASYMAVPARLRPEELGVLLAAVIRQYDPSFAPAGLAMNAVVEDAQRLGRLIPKRLRDELVPYASEISGAFSFDHQALWLGVQHTGNRAGLLAAGSAVASLGVMLRAANHPDLLSARGDPLIEEMLRFVVSNEHCELRASLT
jgi:hypothetical protein